ncbi:MAG: Crp/Fnr family transcriptional regulator [Rhodocyclaceae bacterium]|nr:Crp/Fnr family transcriptional regulator [Rhodocyclaceae bacterium]
MSHTENRIDTAKLLARMPLFDGLPPGQTDLLAAHSRGKLLPKGEMLFQKGDAANGFYLVVYGQIKLAFPSLSGNEMVVDIIGPSQSFGEAVMLAQRPYPVFAQAIMDTLLIHVSKDIVFDLLENDPSFSRRMLIGLAMHNHSLVHDIESYTLRSSTQRVVGYLLQNCPNDENCESSIDIILPTSKQITASRLNLTPETLSRILHDLAEAGLIRTQGKCISINNPRRLRFALTSTQMNECRADQPRPRAKKRPQTVVQTKESANTRCAKSSKPTAELRA